MDTRKKIEKLSDADFKLYLGIDRPTFYTALEIPETENKIQRKKGGTPFKTNIFERLVITLNYYRAPLKTLFEVKSVFRGVL